MTCNGLHIFRLITLCLLPATIWPPSAFAQSISRSGLPEPYTPAVSVDAIFGEIGGWDGVIGDPSAPQTYRDNFHTPTLSALRGANVGPADYDPANVGQRVKEPTLSGGRAQIVIRGEANGGVEVGGIWAEADGFWQRGLGGFDGGADPATVRPLASLSFADGGAGYAVPYDQHFRFDVSTELYGFNAHLAPTGFWLGATLVQPTIGIQHFNFDDSFAFEGATAGINYLHLSTGLVDVTTLDPLEVISDPFQSVLDARTESQMLGPVLGLKFATTGRSARVNGHARGGALWADSEQTLSGRGLGMGLLPGYDPNLAFADRRQDEFVTGFAEVGITLELEPLRLIHPLRRRFRLADESFVIRVGWSFMMLTDLVRSTDSIVWNGQPLVPELKENKTRWYVNTLNVGLAFQY